MGSLSSRVSGKVPMFWNMRLTPNPGRREHGMRKSTRPMMKAVIFWRYSQRMGGCVRSKNCHRRVGGSLSSRVSGKVPMFWNMRLTPNPGRREHGMRNSTRPMMKAVIFWRYSQRMGRCVWMLLGASVWDAL